MALSLCWNRGQAVESPTSGWCQPPKAGTPAVLPDTSGLPPFQPNPAQTLQPLTPGGSVVDELLSPIEFWPFSPLPKPLRTAPASHGPSHTHSSYRARSRGWSLHPEAGHTGWGLRGAPDIRWGIFEINHHRIIVSVIMSCSNLLRSDTQWFKGSKPLTQATHSQGEFYNLQSSCLV